MLKTILRCKPTAATTEIRPRAALDGGGFCLRYLEPQRSTAHDRRPQIIAGKRIMNHRSFTLITNRSRRTLPRPYVAANAYDQHRAADGGLKKPDIHDPTLEPRHACDKIDRATKQNRCRVNPVWCSACRHRNFQQLCVFLGRQASRWQTCWQHRSLA